MRVSEEAQDSPLIKPEKPGSLSFKEWRHKHIHALFWGDQKSHEKRVQHYKNPVENPLKNEHYSPFSAIFMMVFGIDGYDPTTHMIIPAHRHSAGKLQEAYEYKGEPLPWLLIIAAFFGLPTRTGCSEPTPLPASKDYQPLEEQEPEEDADENEDTPPVKLRQLPTLTGWGLLKNMIGGWDTLPEEDKYLEKKIWQWVVLIPVKLLLILPIKLISIPFKTIVNIIKVFTEFLPSLATYGLHILMAKIGAKIATLDESDDYWKIPKILSLSFFSVFLSLLHASFRLITLVGRALFSPDKSANLASASGKEVNRKLGFGIYYVNKFVTSVFWAIMIPIALGAAIIYLPDVIVPVITWFGNLPPVSAALHSMNGALVSFTTEFFAYDITPTVAALSNLLHIPVSETITVIGATLGFFGSTILVIVISWFATPFSDKWAAWHEGGPFTSWLPAQWTALKNYVSSYLQPSPKNDHELENPDPKKSDATGSNPSSTASTLVNGKQAAVRGADEAAIITPTDGTNPQPPVTNAGAGDLHLVDSATPNMKCE